MSFLLQFAIEVQKLKLAAHVPFVSCSIMFSSSPFFHLFFIYCSFLFFPHVLLLITFFHVFSYLHFSICYHTLFISPVIFHLCFIERRENKWAMRTIYTKKDWEHIPKWKGECKKWNNDLILISSLWLPQVLTRRHEFAEPTRSVLPSRQVPRSMSATRKCFVSHLPRIRSIWWQPLERTTPSLKVSVCKASKVWLKKVVANSPHGGTSCVALKLWVWLDEVLGFYHRIPVLLRQAQYLDINLQVSHGETMSGLYSKDQLAFEATWV